MANEMAYNAPPGSASEIGEQINTHHYYKKALIEIRNQQYFQPLANTRAMPKHMGKTIKQNKYIPVLDDRNMNDQGIDASSVTIANTEFGIRVPQLLNNPPAASEADATATTKAHSSGDYVYDVATDGWYLLIADRAVGADLSVADTALTNANIKALIEADMAINSIEVTATVDANGIDVTIQDLVYAAEADADKIPLIIGGSWKYQRSGNLYGSSKDIGLITAKLPALTEHGGRVNRIGHHRVVITGSIVKQGFFSEYTQEAMDFDTDAELMMHITNETLVAANEMTEDNLQKDLINAAGVVHYAGAATSNATISAEGAAGVPAILDYEDLMRLTIEMDDNKCPKSTEIITGSRMIDTRVVNSARYIYCGSEMRPTLERMVDLHNQPAFKSVETYAQAGQVVNGEIGAIGQWRFIVVPEMMSWKGAGASVGTNPGYRATAGRYDVIPLLTVGSGSFTTIGFQTDGKTVKFKIIHKKPGYETATQLDPYGEKGHYAIKWYYGFMALRPEWIGLIKCVAEV